MDSFGKSLKGVKTVKVSLADLSEGASVKDITSQVKLSQDNSVATWTVGSDISIGRYQPVFTLDQATVSAPSITVADKLKLTSVQYAVIQNSKFPSKFDGKVDNPSKIQNIRQA